MDTVKFVDDRSETLVFLNSQSVAGFRQTTTTSPRITHVQDYATNYVFIREIFFIQIEMCWEKYDFSQNVTRRNVQV